MAWNKGKRKYNTQCLFCNNDIHSFYFKKYCSRKCWYENIKKNGIYNKGKSKFISEEEKRLTMLRQGRESYRRHIQTRLFYYRQLSIIRRGVRGKFTKQEWEEMKRKFNYSCADCLKKEPEIKLSIDHIIPISKWSEWLLRNPTVQYQCNDIQNIQPLCKSCNSKKHNKL